MVRGVTKGNAVIMAAIGGGTFSYKGVDYEFIDETKKNLEDLECPICQEILNDPLQTNCGHLFCGKCLQSGGSRVKNCPVCREEYTSTSDQFLTRKINGLKVKCPNASKGCEWSGELRDAEGHVKAASCHLAKVQSKNITGQLLASQHPIGTHGQVPPSLMQPHQRRPWLENDKTFPCTPWVVKFEGYEAMKALNMPWFSDPFFTHSGGYKMCLEVHANGFKTAKGKYLSVYICLRQGEMDDFLKWPFTGKLRFTLLNQVEDNNHLWHTKNSVDYPTQLTRVLPPRTRSSGLGSRPFIQLLSLRDPSQPTIQYLQDDCLYVKVETLSVT